MIFENLGGLSFFCTDSGTSLVEHCLSTEHGTETNQMNKIVCGICHTDKHNEGFYCASCTSFRLLKHRLNLIHLQSINQAATDDINQVLDLCSEEKSRSFLESYLKGESLSMVDEVSSDAIARLAFMLMNVNTMTQINQLDEVWNVLQRKQEENIALSEKMIVLKERKREIEDKLNKIRNTLSNESVIDNNELVTRPIIDLQYLTIKKTQDNCIFQILNWWKLEENKGRISIMSVPIIPITNLTNYHMSLVLESFLKTCQFLKVLSNVYQIRLNHTMGTEQNQLRVGDRVLNVRDLKRFSELSIYGRKEFCTCIGKILQNLITLTLYLDPSYKSSDLSFYDILRFDKLLIHIVFVLKKKINYEKKTHSNMIMPIVEDKPKLMQWFQRKEPQSTTAKPIEPLKMVIPTEQESTMLFQRSLEISSLSNPEILSPPLLPPSAVDAWGLLSNGKLTEALVELLVPEE